MAFTVKSKILMTVLSVVLMFTFFILIYFPSRQETVLLENYNEEIENFANSVALGVKIALTEQNFEGIETAIDFVRDDERLQFVSLIQTETMIDPDTGQETVVKNVFRTYPEDAIVDVDAQSNESYIYKSAPFTSPIMNGEVMLSFSTREIVASMEQIRLTSIIVSLIVFLIGLLIGYSLAKNISRPVLALRDAARKVGQGDLSQSVENISNDEIGELTQAFNKMVRELKIDTAIEKIRSKTTAMQSTGEWENVMKTFFTEMAHLCQNQLVLRMTLCDEAYDRTIYWLSAHDSSEPNRFEKEGCHRPEGENLESINHTLSDNIPFVESLRNQIDELGISTLPDDSVISRAWTGSAGIDVIGPAALNPENQRLINRLSNILDQSFIRYNDLRNSEQQAIEAVKQAALDRIRGEVSSMRSKDDLNKITPLVWRELTTLKVPFNRCGVFIIDEEDHSILCFLSTPDGKALGYFNIDIDDSEITKSVYKGWKSQSVYTQHWDAEDFMRWTNRLIELGHIKNKKNYQDSAAPPESLDLHFVPFKQGMLYVGNDEPLSALHLDLAKSLAEVFSIAFARYEDFTRLEKAKAEVEKALTDLKSTQSQLIHAEKMASLGELTAGIAHEIQNPLNFVNNFADLSMELIEDVQIEINEGNKEELNALIDDLSANLERIFDHGNRASSIVKGMLEHSREKRTSMESANLNEIADEYLRLAYHGFRAKSKSFNAYFKTDFDDSLPEIKMVPQDISRVLLNLINNAFYAVSTRAENQQYGYIPLVKVQTRMKDDQYAEIRVIDNGDGIPKTVIDKIFQPFFTTKPTGEGTGLGLSISYDIITKGHNGTMSVNSQTEEDGNGKPGTEIILCLPIE
ncbi:MAG: ATP-binding protein [Balneolaceae bacterium]|nr:ATP-binding protein [Balneolaceae bacterium]